MRSYWSYYDEARRRTLRDAAIEARARFNREFPGEEPEIGDALEALVQWSGSQYGVRHGDGYGAVNADLADVFVGVFLCGLDCGSVAP
jgi:hypothetical protein